LFGAVSNIFIGYYYTAIRKKVKGAAGKKGKSFPAVEAKTRVRAYIKDLF
jgi:ferritin-like protein